MIPSMPSMPTLVAPGPAAGSAALAQYTFDSDVESWAALSTAAISWLSSDGHTANGCLKFTTAAHAGDGFKSPALTPPAGLQITVSIWMKSPVNMQLGVQEFSDAGGTTSLRSDLSTAISSLTWARRTFTVTLGADCVSYRVILRNPSTTNSGSIVLQDDVVVAEGDTALDVT